MTSRFALQDLRKDARNHLNHHTKYLNDRLDVIEKDLEVLELIKEKAVNLITLKYVVCTEETEEDSLEYYNSLIIQRNELTKEEYKLLKEWLNETNT